MQQFMSAIGRKCSVVNLDPANDQTSYPCAIDVRDLIKLEDIMEEDSLGPNGGVLYALEELEQNMEWLEEGLSELGEDYVLFDCPGQVELYTHHSSLRNIFFKLQKLGYRVRIPITSNNPRGIFADFGTACSSTSFRFILPNPPFVIYLESHLVAACDATDGSTTSERTDENR
jgi:GTPase SAR1 family protein